MITHLQEAQIVKEPTYIIDNPASSSKHTASVVTHNKIEVTLAITLFLVLETKVLCWQLVQIGGEELNALWSNR